MYVTPYPKAVEDKKMQPHPLTHAPLISPVQNVIEYWIDYNSHLNMAFYNVIFDRAAGYFTICRAVVHHMLAPPLSRVSR